MSVLSRNKKTGENHLFVKGAPEGLLARCDISISGSRGGRRTDRRYLLRLHLHLYDCILVSSPRSVSRAPFYLTFSR